MKIWHDDIRNPPDDSWTWARTNEDAICLLQDHYYSVTEISLDHDLGLENEDPNDLEAVFKMGPFPEGIDLVDFMCKMDLVPPKVTIHSWNPIGAHNMAAMLNRFGHDCIIEPFKPKGTVILE
jgi:hypothetical protein